MFVCVTCSYNLERTVQFLSEVRGPPNPSSGAHSLQSTPERPNSISEYAEERLGEYYL